MLYPAYNHDNQTITKLAVALVWSVQPECNVPLGTWIFRNFKQDFCLMESAQSVYGEKLARLGG